MSILVNDYLGGEIRIICGKIRLTDRNFVSKLDFRQHGDCS